MTVYKMKLPKEFDAFDRAEGVDSYVTVIPSAAGLPLAPNANSDRFLEHAQDVFASADEALEGDISFG